MAFDPPGPRNNPPIRDFLYRQEVVAALAVMDSTRGPGAMRCITIAIALRWNGERGSGVFQRAPRCVARNRLLARDNCR